MGPHRAPAEGGEAARAGAEGPAPARAGSGRGGGWWSSARPYVEAFYPLATLALILLLYAVYNGAFAACPQGGPGRCKPLDITALLRSVIPAAKLAPAASASHEALSGRYLWVLMVGLNHLACLAALPFTLYILWASLSSYRNAKWLVGGALLVFVVVAALVAGLVMPEVGAPSGPDVPDLRPPLFQVLQYTARLDVGGIVWIVGWTVAVSYAAAALIALTAGAILWPAPAEDDTRARALELARRMRLLRALLYFGTFALVIISLRFAVEMRWAGDLLRAWQPNPEG
ncbi:MAG TPA: hypothetical protein VF570_10395, partial [Pyrinomonadaceae bacterium]